MAQALLDGAASGRDSEPRPCTVVLKFGGTSVGDPARIRMVAARLVEAHRAGRRVVGVVSAMGGTTDELLSLARAVSDHPPPRELDVLLSAGERISCALVAMAVGDLGVEAISLAGSQAGILTDEAHTKARIREVTPGRVLAALERDRIVLVAGFQGVSPAREITTLGRGGSDTTAVAVAAALGADACEILTDVEGVFTADPRIVPEARKLTRIGYEDMLELAGAGAKVLALRAVDFARLHDVALHVRSSFTDAEGTWIDGGRDDAPIAGIAHATDEPLYRVRGSADAVCRVLAAGNVGCDAVVQRGADVLVAVSREERDRAARALASAEELTGLGVVSVVGRAATATATVERVLAALAALDVAPVLVHGHGRRLALYVRSDHVASCVQALHAALGLASSA